MAATERRSDGPAVAIPLADPSLTLAVADDATPAVRERLARLVEQDDLEALPVIATTRKSCVARLEVGAERLVVKRYVEPGAFLLRTFLRASRARREFHALAAVGRAVENPVRPVAWAERRSLGFGPRSWLVTVELTESLSLRGLRKLAGAERERVVEVVQGTLAARVGALHRAQVFARNLHAKNVLVQPATGAVAFIDLPAAAREAGLSRSQRVHDLACLWKELRHSLDRAALDRFLAGYGAVLGAGVDAALADDVWSRADHLDNKTPVAGAIHRAKRWWRHTRLGQLVTGHSYDKGAAQ